MEVASGAGNCPKNGMVVPPNLPICYSYRRRQSLRSLPGKDAHDGEHGTSLLIDRLKILVSCEACSAPDHRRWLTNAQRSSIV